MSKAQTFDDWFESLQPKPTEAGHMGNLARGEWGQAKARAEKIWNAALASTTDAVPKGVAPYGWVKVNANGQKFFLDNESKETYLARPDGGPKDIAEYSIPLGVLPFDAGGRNYKTRAEFALYIAEEIEAMHKIDRLGGWSKDEITLVDLANELRAALSGRQAATWRAPREPENCGNCHACIDTHDIREYESQLPLNMVKMIVCPDCGNKRCPKASHHARECTNSNEGGQPGSIYPPSSPELNRGNG